MTADTELTMQDTQIATFAALMLNIKVYSLTKDSEDKWCQKKERTLVHDAFGPVDVGCCDRHFPVTPQTVTGDISLRRVHAEDVRDPPSTSTSE